MSKYGPCTCDVEGLISANYLARCLPCQRWGWGRASWVDAKGRPRDSDSEANPRDVRWRSEGWRYGIPERRYPDDGCLACDFKEWDPEVSRWTDCGYVVVRTDSVGFHYCRLHAEVLPREVYRGSVKDLVADRRAATAMMSKPDCRVQCLNVLPERRVECLMF